MISFLMRKSVLASIVISRLYLKVIQKTQKRFFAGTAHYNPANFTITVYVDERHPKDILRSVAHELVHHAQNCRGEFDREMETGEGYAQTDPHLSKMEDEAYLLGNRLVRDYEDGKKTRGEKLYEALVCKFIRRK